MKKFTSWFLFVMLFSITALAQTGSQQASSDKDVLPSTFLRGKKVKYARVTPGSVHATKKIPNAAGLSLNATANSTSCAPQSFALACLDTVINNNNFFREEGVYFDGTSRGHLAIYSGRKAACQQHIYRLQCSGDSYNYRNAEC